MGFRAAYRSQFAKGVSALTIANGVCAALSFVQALITARILGPQQFGLAALIMNYPDVIYGFFDARSNDVSTRFIARFAAKGDHRRAAAISSISYCIDLAIGLLCVAVVLASAPWIEGSLLKNAVPAGVIAWYAVAFIPRAFVNTSSANLLSLGLFKAASVVDALTALVRTVVIVACVLYQPTAQSIVLGNACALGFSGIAYLAASEYALRRCWGKGALFADPRVAAPEFGEYVRMLVCTDISSFLGMLPKQLDIMLLGWVRTPIDVGYYKVAKSIGNVPSYITKPLQSVAYPQMAALCASGGSASVTRAARNYWKHFGFPLFVLSVIGAAALPLVLQPVLGTFFAAATGSCQLWLAGAGVWSCFFWLKPAYLACGRVGQWLTIYTVVTIAGLSGFLLVVHPFGAPGISAVWLCMNIALHLWGAFLLFRKSGGNAPERVLECNAEIDETAVEV
jgi:O-antigen/teichoic acid export membrane protein